MVVFVLGKLLGEGAGGKVRECTQEDSGRHFACKTVSYRSRNEEIEHAKREISSFLMLQQRQLADVEDTYHPNVLSLFDYFDDEEGIHLILDYCEGGDLYDRITSTPEGRFSEEEAAEALKAVCQALLFCHSNGIVHRDVKLENVLLPRVDSLLSEAKLADFGASVLASHRRDRSRLCFFDVGGTPYYMAPELVRMRWQPWLECDQKVDVWSAGVLLFVMLVGMHPLRGSNTEEILDAVANYKSLDSLVASSDEKHITWAWEALVSEGAKDLLRRMLERESSQRLGVEQVLAHPWVLQHNHPRTGSEAAAMPGANSVAGVQQKTEHGAPIVAL